MAPFAPASATSSVSRSLPATPAACASLTHGAPLPSPLAQPRKQTAPQHTAPALLLGGVLERARVARPHPRAFADPDGAEGPPLVARQRADAVAGLAARERANGSVTRSQPPTRPR